MCHLPIVGRVLLHPWNAQDRLLQQRLTWPQVAGVVPRLSTLYVCTWRERSRAPPSPYPLGVRC